MWTFLILWEKQIAACNVSKSPSLRNQPGIFCLNFLLSSYRFPCLLWLRILVYVLLTVWTAIRPILLLSTCRSFGARLASTKRKPQGENHVSENEKLVGFLRFAISLASPGFQVSFALALLPYGTSFLQDAFSFRRSGSNLSIGWLNTWIR